MKRPTLTRFGFISIVVLLFLGEFGFGKARRFSNSPPARFQNDVAWIPLVPEGEEFSAMIPAPPSIQIRASNYLIRKDGERVLAHRVYSGYGSGLVFIIEAYKAEHPQNLWGPLLENEDKSAVFERDLAFDGVTARQYRSPYSSRYATYTRHFVRFTTKEHVYFLTLVTLEETNPVVDQFLSSLRLRRPMDRVTPIPKQSSENIPADVFSGNEVTRKAIIVWKPEPTYTAEARAHQVVGTIILQGILAADGSVADITVTKGLKDGLTESALDAAQNIRFFPAEKDGKPVSQRMRLEYNFNLF